MTLTEVMVYCVLLSLFCTMLFLTMPNRPNATAEDLEVATARADVALRQLTHELGNASASSVTQLTSPAGVAFLSGNSDGYKAFTYLASGEIGWYGWVAYVLDGGKLKRVWYPFKSPTARASVSTTPAASELLKTGKSEVLCQNVSTFAVTLPEANLWQFEIRLKVGASESTLTSGAGARN